MDAFENDFWDLTTAAAWAVTREPAAVRTAADPDYEAALFEVRGRTATAGAKSTSGFGNRAAGRSRKPWAVVAIEIPCRSGAHGPSCRRGR